MKNIIQLFKGVIYQIINIQNNLSYIGKTSQDDYMKYIEKHFEKAINNKDKVERDFYSAIREFGRQNFKVIILGEIISNKLKNFNKRLNQAEKDCIYHFRTFGSDGNNRDNIYGYNMTPGGDGFFKGHKPWLKGFNGKLKIINNDIMTKMVDKEDLQTYLDNGWILGRIVTKNYKNTIWVNNGVENKKSSKQNLQKYLDNGYVLGLINWDFNKNRIRIFKDNIEKRVIQEDLRFYLNNGWRLITKENKHLFAKKYANDTSGNKNGMFGRSVYSVWVEKYGKEEADKKQRERSLKRSRSYCGKMLQTL
jgi:hypothetical protein